MNGRYSKCLRLIICFPLLFWSLVSVGAPHFQVIEGGVIKGEISAVGFSRITLTKGVIHEVIGEEGNYQLLSDQFGSNIFIKPHLPVGKSFAISLVGNNGLVIDMQLTVRDRGASVIIIDADSVDSLAKRQMTSDRFSLKEEILMLKNMKYGRKDKYYVLEINNVLLQKQCTGCLRKIKLIKKTIYRFADLTGVILEVKNNTGEALTIKEEDFSRLFCGSRIIHIENAHVPGKAGTRVFVVTREDERC